MSEGPEVRRIAGELDAALGGARIEAVESRLKAARAWLDAHPGELVGRRIERVRSRGKHILMAVEGGLYVQSHLLMFGKWLVYPAGATPPRDPGDRFWLQTDRALAVNHRGQVLNIGHGDPAAAIPSLAAIGPDILDRPFDGAEFRRRLCLAPDREVGVVLLDQGVAAGVGNYLKAEILYLAGLNPWLSVGSLAAAEVDRLAAAIPEVAQTALRERGRTVPLERAAGSAGLNADQRDRRHWVFRRTNRPCRRCGTAIRQRRQGEPPGRIAYWCPVCQPADARVMV